MISWLVFSFVAVLSGLLASLQETNGNVCNSDEEYMFLNNLLRSKELHALFKVHNKIVEKDRNERYRPVLASSMQIVLEILDTIMPYLEENEDCKELFFHLQKPHLQVSFFDVPKKTLIFFRFPFMDEVVAIVNIVSKSQNSVNICSPKCYYINCFALGPYNVQKLIFQNLELFKLVTDIFRRINHQLRTFNLLFLHNIFCRIQFLWLEIGLNKVLAGFFFIVDEILVQFYCLRFKQLWKMTILNVNSPM